MKKFFALLLALVMSLSLVACGGGDTANEDTSTDDTATEENGGDTATASDVEIAVVLKTLASEYWGYVKAGCDAAAPHDLHHTRPQADHAAHCQAKCDRLLHALCRRCADGRTLAGRRAEDQRYAHHAYPDPGQCHEKPPPFPHHAAIFDAVC